jgi:WXG100 family type VII secretion target
MNRILMHFDETRKVAVQYKGYASEVEQLLALLKSSQTQLEQAWAGRGFEQFQVQFNELVPSVVTFQRLLEDISVFLSRSADVMEEADNRIMISIQR